MKLPSAVADGLTAVTAAGADAGAPRAVPNGLGAGDSLGAAADAIQPVLTSRQQVRACVHIAPCHGLCLQLLCLLAICREQAQLFL